MVAESETDSIKRFLYPLNSFVTSIEKKINPLRLVEIARRVSREYQGESFEECTLKRLLPPTQTGQ